MSQKPRVQCLDRTMNILEALAEHRVLGVTELAKKVGLHVATTHNILLALQARNYLLSEGGQYRLGPALAALASQGDPLMALSRLAQPELEKITQWTGESAVLGVLSGTRVIALAATASSDGLTCPRPGQVFPAALELATGRVLAAYQPEKEWKAHGTELARKIGRTEGLSPEEFAEWQRRLQEIRRTGECVLWRGRDSGSMAVPVRDGTGTVVAALGASSVGRLEDEGHRQRLFAAVRKAGLDVSRALGYAEATK